jgi:hypothetical protein
VETALAHIRIGAETRWFDRSISVDLFSTKKTSTAATQPHYFRARAGSALILFDAFSSREPASTSLENASYLSTAHDLHTKPVIP